MVNKGNNQEFFADGKSYVMSAREQLTEDTCIGIFGNLCDKVLYYNHDIGKWQRGTYHGIYSEYSIFVHEAESEAAIRLKQVLEETPEFSLYELVANVTVVVNTKNYPGYAKWTNEVKYDPTGTAVLGNLIVRPRAGGQLRLWSPAWIGVANLRESDFAGLWWGAKRFAQFVAGKPDFRVALCAGRVR